MRKAFAFLLLALSFLASCSSNPNTQGPGADYLQGEWQQRVDAVQEQLITHSVYRMRFSCDSFFIQQQTISKVNYGADTCMSKGRWTEYMRGVYEQKQDTLRLKGVFCNADFSLKLAGGCFRYGVYQEYFKIVHKADTAIEFTGTNDVVPIQLQLVKRTTCHVKPL